MFELASKLKLRFVKSYDALELCKRLEKEGYTIIINKDTELTYNGEDVYNIYVFKDDRQIIRVMYVNRDDETEYKQYILYYIY